MKITGIQTTYNQIQNDPFQNLNHDQKKEIRSLLNELPQDKRKDVMNQIKEIKQLDNQQYFNAIKETIQNTIKESQIASFNNFSLYA